ncbi:IclR family transcriptional regulator [Cupriavidus basilensis]
MDDLSEKSKASDGVQSIRRALAILRILAAGQEHGVRLVDVVTSTGLSQPTAHRILRVLIAEGAAEQDPETRRYVIGNEVSLLGLARVARFPLRAAAEPYLQYLSETLGDTIFLTIANGDDSVCIGRWPGSYPVKVLSIDVGARRPLGVGVSGLVLLSSRTDDEIRSIVQRNAKRLAALKVDPEELIARTHTVREQGYGYTAKGVVQGSPCGGRSHLRRLRCGGGGYGSGNDNGASACRPAIFRGPGNAEAGGVAATAHR